jgi:hypothetical protein
MVKVPPFTGVPPVGALEVAPPEAAGEPDALVAAVVDADDDEPDAAVELEPVCVVAVDPVDPLPHAARTQPTVETESPMASPRLIMSRRESR